MVMRLTVGLAHLPSRATRPWFTSMHVALFSGYTDIRLTGGLRFSCVLCSPVDEMDRFLASLATPFTFKWTPFRLYNDISTAPFNNLFKMLRHFSFLKSGNFEFYKSNKKALLWQTVYISFNHYVPKPILCIFIIWGER